MSQVAEQDNRGTVSRAGHEVERHLHELDRAMTERGSEPGWLQRFRRDGLAQFGTRGFPTTADEEWKFTSVRPLAETPFAWARDGAGRVAVVNGVGYPNQSLSHFRSEDIWFGGISSSQLYADGWFAGVEFTWIECALPETALGFAPQNAWMPM
jgi:hypothetical protein